MTRSVNRTVGLSPKIGSLALYQVIPFFVSTVVVYYLKELLGFSWIIAAFWIGLLSGASLLLLNDKPWLFFSRLIPVPYVVRGGAIYQPLLELEKESNNVKNYGRSIRYQTQTSPPKSRSRTV
jgi:hypothetical protein